MEIVHNYFETVAPDQKNAPRVGLPRHHLWRDDSAEASKDGEKRAGPRLSAHAAAEAGTPGPSSTGETASPSEGAQ
jgi:hypothetical protein